MRAGSAAKWSGMSTEIVLSEPEPLIERLVSESTLFRGADRSVLGRLVQQVGRRLHLAPGEDLITEGDLADTIYFVESGSFEVRKRSELGGGDHRIGSTHAGAVVGEVALLDQGLRSATVRALEDSVVLALRVGDLERSDEAHSPATSMRLNLAREMAGRVRATTENAVRHLEERLLEEQKRVEMGRFMCRVLIGTCLYMFALAMVEPLKVLVPDSTVISMVILLGFALGLYLNIRTSMFPLSAYGFTLTNWRPALGEAILFSLPILTLIVLLKWVLIQWAPAFADQPLFDFYSYSGLSVAGTLAVVAAYSLFVPVQEMVARSGIQSALMMFLRPRFRVTMSIFMSTLLFSATHLHTGAAVALMVFPVGLFWGWLYSRHPTLIGVVASHLLIGIWTVFVVSFHVF
jgi:CRP-like cAMP-binding protein/membrane protease YdiL (CAAX protease family)